MIGRLIFEFGNDSSWDTEMVAMLDENKSSLLSEVGTQHSGEVVGLGARVVGGSLDALQQKNPAALELFKIMSIVPEDVPAPVVVLGLLWCSHHHQTPPLSRVQLMQLRGSAFSLIDHNLVLGETSTGIYFHDVVRDYARELTGKAALATEQRALVSVLLAAMVESTGSTVDENMQSYAKVALRIHMAEALAGQDLATETDALSWFDTTSALFDDFGTSCAANVFGKDALVAMAETAMAMPQPQYMVAAHRYMCTVLLDEFVEVGHLSTTEESRECVELAEKAIACLNKLNPAQVDADTRATELFLRSRMASWISLSKELQEKVEFNCSQMKKLVVQGFAKPTTSSAMLDIGMALWSIANMCQHNPQTWKEQIHLNEAACRGYAYFSGQHVSMIDGAVKLIPSRDERISIGSGFMLCACSWVYDYFGVFSCLLFPEDYRVSMDEMFGQTSLAAEACEWYDWDTHHKGAVKHGTGFDSYISFGGPYFWLLLGLGDIETVNRWYARLMHVYEGNAEHPGFAVRYNNISQMATWIYRQTGMNEAIRQLFKHLSCEWDEAQATLDRKLFWLAQLSLRSDTVQDRGTSLTYCWAPIATIATKLGYYLASPKGTVDEVEVNAMMDANPPGTWYDTWYSAFMYAESEGFEKLGRLDEAIEAATINRERFPYNASAQWNSSLVEARVRVAQGKLGEADGKFAEAVAMARRAGERFSETMIIKDWFRELLGSERVGHSDEARLTSSQEQMAALGRCISEMVCPAATYTALMQWEGGGIDASAAVEANAACDSAATDAMTQ